MTRLAANPAVCIIWIGFGRPVLMRWPHSEVRRQGWRWMVGVGPLLFCVSDGSGKRGFDANGR